MYRIPRYCNLQFADKYSKRHNYDKGRFDIWLTQGHDGLTDRKKKTNTATSLTTESGHVVIHWLNLLHDYNMKWEMPKLLYEAGDVRNNVTLIILIALQVFQSIYLILAETLS